MQSMTLRRPIPEDTLAPLRPRARFMWVAAHAGGLLIALAGCQSRPEPVDCAGINWQAIGLADATSGEPAETLEKRLDACIESPDEAARALAARAYRAGHTAGLEIFCTADRGYAYGRTGAAYQGVCPPARESAFLAAYEAGYGLYDLGETADKARADYDRAVELLARHRYNLTISRNRYDDPTLANEDREIARLDMEHHAREIDRLETDLPDYQSEAEAAEAAFAAAQNGGEDSGEDGGQNENQNAGIEPTDDPQGFLPAGE